MTSKIDPCGGGAMFTLSAKMTKGYILELLLQKMRIHWKLISDKAAEKWKTQHVKSQLGPHLWLQIKHTVCIFLMSGKIHFGVAWYRPYLSCSGIRACLHLCFDLHKPWISVTNRPNHISRQLCIFILFNFKCNNDWEINTFYISCESK